MRHTLEMGMARVSVFVAAGLFALTGLPVQAQSPTDWPAAAGDVGATKYAPVDQITPANVAKLAQAGT